MISVLKSALRIALVATGFVIAGASSGARAQTYPEPLYPYVVQPQYYQPYPSRRARGLQAAPVIPASPQAAVHKKPKRSKIDPALVEELRSRGARAQRGVLNSKPIIVREPPVVIESRRVVNDPPRVVERHYEVDDNGAVVPTDPPDQGAAYARPQRGAGKQTPRVIRAEAEVTILGPDRMSIRLFRKRPGGDANARSN